MLGGDPLAGVEPVVDVPEAFAAAVLDAFARRPGRRFTLVLSGGATAEACYEQLARTGPGGIDWSSVDLYLGDERDVPADHADANQRMVRRTLVDRVGSLGSFRPMPTGEPLDRCADDYDALVASALATTGLDLVHLGLGPDGHTASLFPGAAALEAGPGRLVVATADPNGRNPHRRLSLTLEAIGRARQVVFTVAGRAKRPAVARLRQGEDLPAARVRAGRVTWLVDRDAFAVGADVPAKEDP